jgi:hypothetical protein
MNQRSVQNDVVDFMAISSIGMNLTKCTDARLVTRVTAELWSLWILGRGLAVRRCEMKRDKFGRTAEYRGSGSTDDTRRGVEFDAYMQKVSTEYYERSWRDAVKERKADIWIAIGLYLILTSVAFVVL